MMVAVDPVLPVLLRTGTRSAANLIHDAEDMPHVQDAGSSPLPHGGGPGPAGHPGMPQHHPGGRYGGTHEAVRGAASVATIVKLPVSCACLYALFGACPLRAVFAPAGTGR